MILYVKCPTCGHFNGLSLDDLMGKYAECVKCQNLIKVIEDKEPGSNGDETNEDENSTSKNSG